MGRILEGIKLGTTAIMVNPYELMVFDKIVGKRNRSKAIRILIKEFNKKQEKNKPEAIKRHRGKQVE